MSEQNVFQNLVEDHEVILKALNVFNEILERLEKGEIVKLDIVEDLLKFFKEFVDGCHHVKEEVALFPRLNERGIPGYGGPIGVMVFEHERGREYIKAMESALKNLKEGNEEAKRLLIDNGKDYVDLLSAHISKENEILFPMGEQVLTEKDQQELHEEFERIEKDKGHDRYVAMVERIEKSFS